jgi:hypothetical protein
MRAVPFRAALAARGLSVRVAAAAEPGYCTAKPSPTSAPTAAGRGRPRRDGVDGDAPPAQLFSQDAGHRLDGGFGAGIEP